MKILFININNNVVRGLSPPNYSIAMKTQQQHETIYIPYCYLIGWSEQNKFYYGVRYSIKTNCLYKSGCHPDDFWVTYFTSSKYVAEYRKLYGEPDIVQIRKIFKTSNAAISWEEKVLRRLNVASSDKFINKNVSGCINWDDNLRAKVTGRIGYRRGRSMQEMQPGWVNPIKGTTAAERYKQDWTCYRKGKTIQEIWGDDYIDPRSQSFTIRSIFLGDLFFNNVTECKTKTGLDGISIIRLKREGVRKIKRRKTTKHVFLDGDILTIVYTASKD
jgi:hypothetical protein